MMKLCRKCGITKEVEAFARRSSRPSGRQSQCRECYVARYAENKDRVKAISAAWYAENKDRKKATCAAWEAANKDQRKAYMKAWHASPEAKARGKAYRQENREVIRARGRVYRKRQWFTSGRPFLRLGDAAVVSLLRKAPPKVRPLVATWLYLRVGYGDALGTVLTRRLAGRRADSLISGYVEKTRMGEACINLLSPAGFDRLGRIVAPYVS